MKKNKLRTTKKICYLEELNIQEKNRCNQLCNLGFSKRQPTVQRFYSWCPLHRDSAEILRFAAETCLLMSTTNRFISLSHGETVN